MYLVGRDDETVEPFFVKMSHDIMTCHPNVAALMDHAYLHRGWWWELMEIPDHFPPAPPGSDNQQDTLKRKNL